MWVESSTVSVPIAEFANGTIRNGLSSVTGLAASLTSAERNLRWFWMRCRSAFGNARVRTKPSAWGPSSVWHPAGRSMPAFGSSIASSRHMSTPPIASTMPAKPSKPISA